MQHTISIKGMAFNPKSLTIAAGDTVVWQNQDKMGHTATRDDSPGAFETGDIPGGSTSQPITFAAASGAGGFAYVCEYHATMTGTLVVTA